MPHPFKRIEFNGLPSPEGGMLYWLNIALYELDGGQLAPVFDKNPLVLVPHRLGERATRFLEMHKIADVETFNDMLDPRLATFGSSPSEAAYRAADARAEGRAVVLLEYGPRISGLIPAMLTVLAFPDLHPLKATYSLVADGYELFPDQFGYISGWLEGAQRRKGYESGWG